MDLADSLMLEAVVCNLQRGVPKGVSFEMPAEGPEIKVFSVSEVGLRMLAKKRLSQR